MRFSYKILFGNSEWRIPLGRPMCRWIMILKKEIAWEGIDCVYLAQSRVHW